MNLVVDVNRHNVAEDQSLSSILESREALQKTNTLCQTSIWHTVLSEHQLIVICKTNEIASQVQTGLPCSQKVETVQVFLRE